MSVWFSPSRSGRRRTPLAIGADLCVHVAAEPVGLDSFFASLSGSPLPQRGVSDRAFAKARAHLYMPALTALSDMLVQRAEQAGLVPRWHGLRVLAADGSVLMPAVRACKRTKSLASADQRLFALYLPGAELTLHASVYDPTGSGRQMLVESLNRLGPQDLLVLDRGYPAAWLVALLDERGIRWCMRCDNDSGWKALRGFARAGAEEAGVSLSPPSAEDVQTWGCARAALRVRLVRLGFEGTADLLECGEGDVPGLRLGVQRQQVHLTSLVPGQIDSC
ncbi:MAG: hypothetical protein HYZ20_05335 [Burkholderiales bacterium]|nr:hypothetical protein [Burkholderiales bacterium]